MFKFKSFFFVKKIIIFLILMFFLSFFTSVYIFSQHTENAIKIVIYHTNDIHGQVKSNWVNGELIKIGLDIVKGAKNSTPNSILVDAGDFIQGSPFGKHEKGKKIIELMNLSGYDFATLGNHEFDIGIEELKKRVTEAKFKILSANVLYENTPFLNGIGNSGNSIIEIEGKKIAFFGITTEETLYTTPPNNTQNLSFGNEIAYSSEEVEKLRAQGADVIVGITHLGMGASTKVTSEDIAKKVKGLDIIIDGHSHESYTKLINGVTISQTGTGLNNLGCIEIVFDKSVDDKKFKVNSKLINSHDAGKLFTPDYYVKKIINNYNDEISNWSQKVIGKTQNSLFGGAYFNQNIGRYFEIPMGNLICDSMIYRAKNLLNTNNESFSDIKKLPIIAFENGGSVKNTIQKGYITTSDIISVLPLDNVLTFQIIDCCDLYDLLERGIGKIQFVPNDKFIGGFGGFPQVSGIHVEYDVLNKPYDYISNTPGKRVVSVSLVDSNEKEIKKIFRDDKETKILFLCNDYTLYEFPSIINKEILYKDKFLYEILEDYILKLTLDGNGSFNYPFSKNRIILKNDKFPKFNSEITLKDSSGLLIFTNATVLIDNCSEKQFKTDEKGKIYLKNLKSGPHKLIIKCENKIKEVIVSNVSELKNLNIFIDDEDNEDDIKVSNIIGQIPYNINISDINFINFARISYDSLTNSQKSKVFNYNKLENAEKEISRLRGNIVSDFFAKDDNKKIIVLVFLLIVSILLLCITSRSKRKTINLS